MNPQRHHEVCVVLHAHRRLLIVRAYIGGSAVAFVAGHGPDVSKPSVEVMAWWQQITAAMQKVQANDVPVVCFLDANGRVGERTSIAIGSRAADPEDAPGNMG